MNDNLKSVSRLRAVVMACSLCAAIFILFGRFPEFRQTVIRIHYLGLGALFAFLIFGELCHLVIFRRVRHNSNWQLIARMAHFWRVITDLMPGAAALIILSTGLRLIYEGNHSLRLTWLFVLVAGFGILFADGLLGYTPAVASLNIKIDTAESQAEFRSLVLSVRFNLMFLLHFISMPVLYLVGRYKLLPTIPPLCKIMTTVDRCLLPFTGRMTGVVTAILLVALEALAVFLIRRRRR